MKRCFFIITIAAFTMSASAQIDLNNLNLDKILGKVLNVKRGYAPKFSLGSIPIPKILKVAEIIGFNCLIHLKQAVPFTV